jgi:hypothetical protein
MKGGKEVRAFPCMDSLLCGPLHTNVATNLQLLLAPQSRFAAESYQRDCLLPVPPVIPSNVLQRLWPGLAACIFI